MDKQKRIEEVTKEVYENSNYSEVMSKDVARYIVKNGYRKIPENAVVLTGTETVEYLEDLLVDFDEMSFFPATLTPNPEEYAREWKRNLIYAIGQLRKETAKEILQGFNKWLNQAISISYEKSVKGSVRYGGMNNAFHEVKELVKKVAEEKGVEVE